MSETRSKVIARLRDRATVTDVAPLLSDACLLRLCRAWPSIPIKIQPRTVGEAAGMELTAMQVQWRGVTVDEAQIAALAHIPRLLVRRILTQAKTFGLVYADGTVNPQAQRVLDLNFTKELKKQGLMAEPIPPKSPDSK